MDAIEHVVADVRVGLAGDGDAFGGNVNARKLADAPDKLLVRVGDAAADVEQLDLAGSAQAGVEDIDQIFVLDPGEEVDVHPRKAQGLVDLLIIVRGVGVELRSVGSVGICHLHSPSLPRSGAGGP